MVCLKSSPEDANARPWLEAGRLEVPHLLYFYCLFLPLHPKSFIESQRPTSSLLFPSTTSKRLRLLVGPGNVQETAQTVPSPPQEIPAPTFQIREPWLGSVLSALDRRGISQGLCGDLMCLATCKVDNEDGEKINARAAEQH